MDLASRRRKLDWIDDVLAAVDETAIRPSWSAVDRCLEPLVDVENHANDIIANIDLPCVEKKEDIKIFIGEDTLEVAAELKKAIKWERWGHVQKKIEFTSFKKTMRLPERVKPEVSQAVFKNGILRIRMPKTKKRVILKVS
jgi:HSP20 family protein